MPQILIDWNQWWLAFWTEHPVMFWACAIAAVLFTVFTNRLRRRSR